MKSVIEPVTTPPARNELNHRLTNIRGMMVAKGLDLPRVTLVGVVSADTGLNLPDFRAGEKSFQLLSQVAGRAGRGILGGKVIIQTFYPRHYAIQAALTHNYISFYNKEITYRRQLHNPPFSRIVRLIYSHTNDALCQKEAGRMKRLLATEMDAAGTGKTIVSGLPWLPGENTNCISPDGAVCGGRLSPFTVTVTSERSVVWAPTMPISK